MAMELPAAQKVHTHVYDNFKGVDFTNDSTNVWHRRSPDAVNMLPDDSGRPFKRTGWEVVVSVDELSTALGKDTQILKCHYFELAGTDHVVVFAEGGVFVYYDGETHLLTTPEYDGDSTDIDCYTSYDRAFFFEGGGKSAFYIYGNYKMWVYGYNNGDFYFAEANDIYIPRILISTNPSDCSGTMLESYNLLGNKASVEYTDNNMFYWYATGNFTANISKTDFDTKMSLSGNPNKTYEFVYTTQWDLVEGGSTIASNITLSEYGVSILGTPEENDTIVLKYIWGLLLPNNVTQNQISEVKVEHSILSQFDEELEVGDNTTTPTATTCSLHTDLYSKPEPNRRAWIEFYGEEKPLVDGEDCIRVTFPVTTVNITNYPIAGHESDCQYEGSASIIK